MMYGMRLYVGIDLDNTILSYDKLLRKLALELGFVDGSCPRRPRDIRLSLRAFADNEIEGERRWQRLQTMVYGTRIDDAEIDPHFNAAMAAIRNLGGTILLIAQKKDNPELPPDDTYREKVMETLRKRKFFDSEGFDVKEEHVYFCRTWGEKVAKIKELRLDTFIDDKPRIFDHPLFPKKTFGIRLGEKVPKIFSVQSWPEITAAITTFAATKTWPVHVEPLDIDPYNLFIEVDAPKGRYIYKQYPDQEWEGWNGTSLLEKAFFQTMTKNRVKGTPKFIGETMPGMLLNRHKTHPVTPKTPGFIEFTKTFLIDLCKLEYGYKTGELYSTAEARCILKDHMLIFHHHQRLLEERFDAIKKDHPHFELYAKACEFMRRDYTPEAAKACAHFYDQFEELGYTKAKDAVLDAKLQFLSPLDISRRNCVIDEKTGAFLFTHFETSGWDDPAKFICDLRYSPQMDFTRDEREYLIKAFVNHRVKKDPKLPERVRLLEPAIRLEWVRSPLLKFLPKRLAKAVIREQKTEEAILEQALDDFQALYQKWFSKA